MNVFTLFSIILTAALLVRVIQLYRKYEMPSASSLVAPSSPAPTVSVCIAARNETHALANALDRILQSSYQKIEILVLDDQSEDDTSLIIKSYAQAGVRFIPGRELPAGWTGRNHAYNTLAEESSGDLLLYVDVDTVIGVTTIEQIVSLYGKTDRTMISIAPRRKDLTRLSALLGTSRYIWELLFSSAKHMPASSAVWIVDRATLLGLDRGISEYARSLHIERNLAYVFSLRHSYAFYTASKQLQLSYEKQLRSQYETAIRLYAPIAGHSLIKQVCIVLLLTILNVATIYSMLSIFEKISIDSAAQLALLFAFGLVSMHYLYEGPLKYIRVLLWPYLLIVEEVLLVRSIIIHATDGVTWKGRKVTEQPTNHSHYSVNE